MGWSASTWTTWPKHMETARLSLGLLARPLFSCCPGTRSMEQHAPLLLATMCAAEV